MIIRIKGADFSGANIGTLDTYTVSKSIGSGATHNIPNYVANNTAVEWTITLADGYTFGTYSITMGGSAITPSISTDGLTMTISIASVTGNISINVATVNESTGEEDSDGETAVAIDYSITPYTDGVTLSSGTSVGSTGTLSNNASYNSYTFKLPNDGTIYPADFFVNNCTYLALYHSGTATRYRKSESNLPTQASPLSVSAGDQIIITTNVALSHIMRIIYNDGTTAELTDTVIGGADMVVHESYTASEVNITADTNYNTYAYTVDVSEGFVYLTDFPTSYCALLVKPSEDDTTMGKRFRYSDSNLPMDTSTLVPVGLGTIIYVSIRDEESPTFNIHLLSSN